MIILILLSIIYSRLTVLRNPAVETDAPWLVLDVNTRVDAIASGFWRGALAAAPSLIALLIAGMTLRESAQDGSNVGTVDDWASLSVLLLYVGLGTVIAWRIWVIISELEERRRDLRQGKAE